MMLFDPTWLDLAMCTIPERVEQLGERLSLPDSACWISKAEGFRKACQNRDVEQVNDLLTRAICDFLGSREVSHALTNYCAKFGITVDLAGKSNLNRLREVASHREQIRAQLAQQEL